MKHIYTLENLNCANCAAKIEAKIAATPGFDKVSFNFATKTLRLESEAEDPRAEVQQICDSIEDGVRVTKHSEHRHEHHDHHEHHGDCCGHDHDHEHGHGHNHSHGHSHGEHGTAKKLLLAAGIALLAAALVCHLTLEGDAEFFSTMILSAGAALAAGYEVLLGGFKNLIRLRIDETVLMTVAVIAAFCIGEFTEAAMVAVLFAVGEMIEDLAVGRSRRDIEKLSAIRPDTAVVLENGAEKTVDAQSVKIGSTIIVKPHERVPLDGEVTQGESTLDVSALTGESLPQTALPGGKALSGSVNGDGLLKIKTEKEFGDSTATRILRLVEDAAAQKGKREKLITRFAAVYTPIVIAIAVLAAVVPPLAGLGDFSVWLYRALTVLVAGCPCAIVISVPLAYYSGIGAGSRMGVLIKGGKYLEALARADTFAFDKTGTLTTGRLSVGRVTACEGYTADEVLDLAAACEKYSSHPIALAIKDSAKNADAYDLSDYRETAANGVFASYKNKTLACGGERILKSPFPGKLPGGKLVYLALDGSPVGAIEITDTVRSEARSVISSLKRLGVRRLVMLTGDSRGNADAVGAELGMSECKAELLPEEKLSETERLKAQSKAVCFVGDGINDAPVLGVSDCGIAMGLGSEAAIEASDAVLSSGNLTALPKAVKISRKTLSIIRFNLIFSLCVKAAVIVLACFGLAAMWMSVAADTGVCVLCVLIATLPLAKIKQK